MGNVMTECRCCGYARGPPACAKGASGCWAMHRPAGEGKGVEIPHPVMRQTFGAAYVIWLDRLYAPPLVFAST